MKPRRPLAALAALLFAAACGSETPDEPLAAPQSSVAAEDLQPVRGLLARGLGQDALARAQTLQAEHPGSADVHLLAGDARGMLGDFAGAARDYRRAADLAFTEPTALRLGEALNRSGQSGGAAEVFQRFLARNPDNAAVLTAAGDTALEAADWPRAIRMYERVRRRIGDEDAILLNNLAWAYLEQDDYGRALPLAEKAWSLDRTSAATADTLGWILFKSGSDQARARILLEQAARAAPADARIRSHLEAARVGRQPV